MYKLILCFNQIRQIKFSSDDLGGKKISRKDYFQEKYGVEDIAHNSNSGETLIEDSIAMLATDETNKNIPEVSNKKDSSVPTVNILTPKVRSKSGKKRIAPQLVSVVPVNDTLKNKSEHPVNISRTPDSIDPLAQATKATEEASKRVKFSKQTGNGIKVPITKNGSKAALTQLHGDSRNDNK